MQSQLIRFIDVLRGNEVRVSTAEALDAMAVMDLLGYSEREALRDGLALALAKTADEKAAFARCFERFFGRRLPAAASRAEQEAAAEAPGGALAGRDAGRQRPQPSGLAGEMAGDAGLRARLDTPLLRMLQADDRNGLALAIARAGERAGLAGMRMFTQKGLFTRRMLDELGEARLRQAAVELERRHSPALRELQAHRERLRELARDHVEREYLLRAEGHGRQFIEEALASARLANIERHHLHKVRELVRKMARKLAARHSRRRRIRRRGQLHAAKTLRRGIARDGVMFSLHWKAARRERPRIFAVCDVSGSVAAYARFLLMFLHCLQDVLPKVRSFAFSSRLGEVSDMFARHPVEKAVELASLRYGGATDYGNSLLDFAALALDDIDRRSTVLVLGDARNNHGDPQLELMRSIYLRAGKVIWLNPESRKLWGSGDSEMPRYLSCCHYAAECGSLRQLERVVERLLRGAG